MGMSSTLRILKIKKESGYVSALIQSEQLSNRTFVVLHHAAHATHAAHTAST